MEAELSGNSNTSFLFFNNSFLDLKAMFTKFGNTIAMLEQKHGLKPQVCPNASEQTFNFSPLSGNSQCEGVDQEQKTYSIAQNNLSSESDQSQIFSERLAVSQSVSDDNDSKTYFSFPSTSFSLPNEGMFLYFHIT